MLALEPRVYDEHPLQVDSQGPTGGRKKEAKHKCDQTSALPMLPVDPKKLRSRNCNFFLRLVEYDRNPIARQADRFGELMKTLIVGTGALGGVIGAHLLAAGASVSLATRSATAAEEIKASGLRVTGLGRNLTTEAGDVARLDEYSVPGTFDLIILATKAQDAIDVASSLVRLIAPGGTLLPIQNGEYR
jgi:Ketopantoate reductase PanE/ApbA